MTKIKFFKDNIGFYKLEALGHTNFDECGKDVLCATISSITQTGALGLTKVLNLKAKIKVNEETGYILVELPKNLNNETRQNTNIIFETLYVALLDIESGYSDYIKLEVIDNVY